MSEKRDEFLSEEDLDLRSLTMKQLFAYWNLWLRQAQATNELDRLMCSHGAGHLVQCATGEGDRELVARRDLAAERRGANGSAALRADRRSCGF